jgi:hypothetical protein
MSLNGLHIIDKESMLLANNYTKLYELYRDITKLSLKARFLDLFYEFNVI